MAIWALVEPLWIALEHMVVRRYICKQVLPEWSGLYGRPLEHMLAPMFRWRAFVVLRGASMEKTEAIGACPKQEAFKAYWTRGPA